MGGEWKAAPLEDCMSAIIDYRGKTPNKTASGVPLVTAKVVKGGRILPTDEFIADNDFKSWMRRGMPAPGDIVMTTEAPLGEIAQLGSERVALAQRLITLRGKPEVLDNTFLKFLMQSSDIQEQLYARSTGTTVLGIKQSELRKVKLTLPPILEQRAIAHILGTLDDKIELNRKMNETLEAMARALFNSWFVDFEPVRSKVEGRNTGLPKEIADLFPDSFDDSDLGEVPKGWNISPLPEVIEVNPLRSLSKGQAAPYLDMANVPTNTARANEVVEREFSSGSKFKNGDTLLARITPCLENGKTAYVDFLEVNQVGWGSTEFIVLRPKPPLPAEFAYFLARDESFRTFAISNMTGTSGRQRVPADCFYNFIMATPSPSIAAVFGYQVSAMMQRIKANDEESLTLATQRDALLPKLLSGGLSIKNAERFVMETV